MEPTAIIRTHDTAFDRGLSMLLCHCAADCVGSYYEFRLAGSAVALWRPEVRAGGPFRWRKGQSTDDGDLTLITLRALARGGSDSQILANLKRGMAEWLQNDPPDVGNATRLGIDAFANGHVPDIEGKKGNGALMRVAPFALIPSLSRAMRLAMLATELTHDTVSYCVGYVALLHGLIHSTTPVTSVGLESTYHPAAYLRDVVRREGEELGFAAIEGRGHAWDAAAAALRAPGFMRLEELVQWCVSFGGDTDTISCVAAAVWGARYAQTDHRWFADCEATPEITRLVDQMFN